MIFNTGIKVLSSLIILTCLSMKNKRFESRSESFFQKHSDTITDNGWAEWMKEERKFWDSACTAETARAESDIKKNKLVYFHYFGMVDHYRSNVEMNELLKKYNIEVDSALTYCTVPGELQNCYGHVMSKEIDRKFGPKFIDSLRHIAEIEYVNKNLDKVYDFEECDTISRYPGSKSYTDFFEGYKKDFWKNVQYPKGFEYRNDKDLYSSMSANFIIHKDGSVSDINVSLRFHNKNNYKYSSYFINETKNFIKKTKWVPATTMGITINSRLPLTFFFK